MKLSKWLIIALSVGLVTTTLALAGCYTTTTTETGETASTIDWVTTAIFLVAIVAIFYFLIIRPQRKRQKSQRELMEGLKRGDKVITVGGIYGQIESVDEETVVIKVESGSTLRVARAGIAGKRE